MPKSLSTLAGAALLLAGCGGAPAAPEAAPATLVAAGPFNAVDACATLPKERVAAIMGLAVDRATLSTVVLPEEGTAGFSICTYSFAGGGTLAFFTRQSPIDDNTAEAIARTELIDTIGTGVIDVPGLGTAAFSTEEMHQLHVFIGGGRYIYFMSPAPPAARPIAEAERALARAVIG